MIQKIFLSVMLHVALSACYMYLMKNGAYPKNAFMYLIICIVVPAIYAGLKDDKNDKKR